MKQLLISSLLAATLFLPVLQAEVSGTPKFKDYAVFIPQIQQRTRFMTQTNNNYIADNWAYPPMPAGPAD